MKTKTVPTAHLTYSTEDKILTIRFLPRKNIDVEAAKSIVSAASELSGDERHANLADSRDLMFMSNDARKYFGQQNKKTVMAIALLIQSKIQESFGNLYLRFSSPSIPTKMFTNENEAKQWLKTILENQK